MFTEFTNSIDDKKQKAHTCPHHSFCLQNVSPAIEMTTQLAQFHVQFYMSSKYLPALSAPLHRTAQSEKKFFSLTEALIWTGISLLAHHACVRGASVCERTSNFYIDHAKHRGLFWKVCGFGALTSLISVKIGLLMSAWLIMSASWWV